MTQGKMFNPPSGEPAGQKPPAGSTSPSSHQDVEAADETFAVAGSCANPPSWALIIQGKLVDPASVAAAAGAAGQTAPASGYQPPQQPFTHYIRRLSAKLDSEQYSGGEEHVHWEKGQHVRNHQDSFEIR